MSSPQPSTHRLGPGLPGYLIPFAPLAFAPQRQKGSSPSLSPPAFLRISTHFTAPPEVPQAPTSLEASSFQGPSPVELGAFTPDLRARLPLDSALQPEGLHRARGVARSGLRPFPKILDCSHP